MWLSLHFLLALSACTQPRNQRWKFSISSGLWTYTLLWACVPFFFFFPFPVVLGIFECSNFPKNLFLQLLVSDFWHSIIYLTNNLSPLEAMVSYFLIFRNCTLLFFSGWVLSHVKQRRGPCISLPGSYQTGYH